MPLVSVLVTNTFTPEQLASYDAFCREATVELADIINVSFPSIRVQVAMTSDSPRVVIQHYDRGEKKNRLVEKMIRQLASNHLNISVVESMHYLADYARLGGEPIEQ